MSNDDNVTLGGVQAFNTQTMVPVAPLATGLPHIYPSMVAPQTQVPPPSEFGVKPTIPTGLAKPSFTNTEELRVMIARQMAINFQLMVQMLLMVRNLILCLATLCVDHIGSLCVGVVGVLDADSLTTDQKHSRARIMAYWSSATTVMKLGSDLHCCSLM